MFFVASTSFFVHAQNPTVINDSLVVNNRVYAKEKLIVDQEAKFKQDIKVLGTARLIGDLVIDGVAKFNGNVKMEGISTVSALADSSELLIRMPNGQLKTVEMRDFIVALYAKDCGDPMPVSNPIWANGLNKIYTSYCSPINVGINTTAPQFELDVVGMSYSDKIKTGNRNAIENAVVNVFDATNSRDLMQLGLHSTSTGSISDVRFLVRHNGSVFIRCSDANNALEIRNGNGKAIVAYSNTGTKILQVENNGLLRTREIRIDAATWADFVFDKNYELPKLKDVAKYIEKNQHLPGIPSSNEIKENGINVGEMQTLQMQKIEELTLYMIEMDKKMDAMQSEIDNLKKENNQLKQTSTK
jgi:hypothetical protein